MNKHWRKNFWRSRALAIFGAIVVFLALFSGFPGWLERPLYLILGLLIVIFGLAGSKPEVPPEQSSPAEPK